MNKFKIGDKVKSNSEALPELRPMQGIIIDINGDLSYKVRVKFSEGQIHERIFHYSENELVTDNSRIIKERLGIK